LLLPCAAPLQIFPQRLGTPFPRNFVDNVRTICKRLYRVYVCPPAPQPQVCCDRQVAERVRGRATCRYAHMYHSHFQKICSLGEEAHLNTCFKHFIYFCQHFNLIDKKELAPLQELIDSLHWRRELAGGNRLPAGEGAGQQAADAAAPAAAPMQMQM